MPVTAMNNIRFICSSIFGIHFGYTFCQAEVLSPILADGPHNSFLHTILRVQARSKGEAYSVPHWS